LAIFGRKKAAEEPQVSSNAVGGAGDGGDSNGGVVGTGESGFGQDPESAKRFFEHAKASDQVTNYEYAMYNWLRGMRFDPLDMAALESFVASALKFNASKKKLSKDTVKEFSGKDKLDKYLSALLAWSVNPADGVAGIRAAQAAVNLGVEEPAYWLAERALRAVNNDKPRKSLYLQLMKVFAALGSYDHAVKCGEAACNLDPTDGALAAEVKNFAARAAMSRGGYEKTGQEGGFRENIRNLDKQRELEDEDRIVKTEETVDRLIKKGEHDLKINPGDNPTLLKLVENLKLRGRPEDEKRAFELLNQAYERTKEFRFRQMAGDLKMRVARRKLESLRKRAEADPDDQDLRDKYEKFKDEVLQLEISEYKLRVDNYPTDLVLKYELGKREFQRGDYEQAIALFQKSQNESKHRVASRSYLGRAFLAIDWVDEAVQTFRDALQTHKNSEDQVGLELRYLLMTALEKKAEKDRDIEAAKEADKLASAIAIQQIGYRDVRERRDAIKKIISDIEG
jgi:tetratricopeptide (TPR) repeat protein